MQRPLRAFADQPILGTFVVLGILAGTFLRVWALGRITINSDNAVVGLMAREILHGHLFAFYWGQPYGGAEAYPVALVFAIFGVSAFTLGLTPAVLTAVSAIVLWRVGNRLIGSPIGAIAAVLFWIWPAVYVTSSVVEDGFRWLVLLCGLCLFLFLLRIRDGDGHLWDWAALGFAAGLGWWASPEMAYYLIPGGVYFIVVVARRIVPLHVVEVACAIGTALIGSLPWWWHNLPHHFVSLHAPPQPSPQALGQPKGVGPYSYHLNLLAHDVFPMLLGLKIPLTGDWLGPSNVARALALAGFAICLITLLALAVANRGWLLVSFVAAFPFIYAQSPFAWYWEDGRYGVFLAPAMALLFACFVGFVLDVPAGMRASLMQRNAPAHGRRAGRVVAGIAAAVLLLPALALTIAGDRHVDPYRPNADGGPARTSWTTWRTDPNNLPAELGTALERLGVHDAYAGYWLAYDVTFLTDKGVLVTPSGPAYVRYAPYFKQVSASSHPAWIFVSSSGQLAAGTEAQTVIIDPGCNAPGEPCLVLPELERWLHAHHMGYSVHDIGPYIVVIPAGRALPGSVFGSVGIH